MSIDQAETERGPPWGTAPSPAAGPSNGSDQGVALASSRRPAASDEERGRRRRAAEALREGAVRLEAVWSGLADFVRRQGESLGKRVELVATGGELEVSGPAATALRTALVHLARDACDQRVESPAARQGAGKSALAIVRLSARRTGDRVEVTLADDGRGVSVVDDRRSAIEPRRRAARLPLALLNSRPTPLDVDIDRRGMDVVREAVENAGGVVALASSPGRGAAFTLTVPAPRERARPAA